MGDESQKAFRAMDNLKAAKDKRKKEKAKEVRITKFVSHDAPTVFEQQKLNIQQLENKQYTPEVKQLFDLERFNVQSQNLLDPFDVQLTKKKINQKVLASFSIRTFPILYMTHVFEELSRYCVLNIKAYSEDSSSKKVIFIDPGINDLAKGDEYENIDLLHRLANSNLPPNVWISIDYPVDLDVSKTTLFLQKSIKNNFRYADNEQYICCIQIEKQDDFEAFKYRFDELSEIFLNKRKIVGLGCFHSLQPNAMQDKMIQYLCSKGNKIFWIHFYGIGLALVKKYFPLLQSKGIRVSFDSTKYRFAVNDWVKKNYGLIANNTTAPIFFYSYVKELLEVPLDLIW